MSPEQLLYMNLCKTTILIGKTFPKIASVPYGPGQNFLQNEFLSPMPLSLMAPDNCIQKEGDHTGASYRGQRILKFAILYPMNPGLDGGGRDGWDGTHFSRDRRDGDGKPEGRRDASRPAGSLFKNIGKKNQKCFRFLLNVI